MEKSLNIIEALQAVRSTNGKLYCWPSGSKLEYVWSWARDIGYYTTDTYDRFPNATVKINDVVGSSMTDEVHGDTTYRVLQDNIAKEWMVGDIKAATEYVTAINR